MSSNPVAVVTGVGPGTGAAIARRFSGGGYAVAMLARSRERLISLEREIYARARDAFATYAAGIDQALSPNREFIVGDSITLADICFVAEMSLFFNERTRQAELREKGFEPILQAGIDEAFPRAFAHFTKLRSHSAFAPDVEPYLTKLKV